MGSGSLKLNVQAFSCIDMKRRRGSWKKKLQSVCRGVWTKIQSWFDSGADPFYLWKCFFARVLYTIWNRQQRNSQIQLSSEKLWIVMTKSKFSLHHEGFKCLQKYIFLQKKTFFSYIMHHLYFWNSKNYFLCLNVFFFKDIIHRFIIRNDWLLCKSLSSS